MIRDRQKFIFHITMFSVRNRRVHVSNLYLEDHEKHHHTPSSVAELEVNEQYTAYPGLDLCPQVAYIQAGKLDNKQLF